MSDVLDAQVGGAVAVDLDAQLGLVELERGVGVDDAAAAPSSAAAQLLGVVGERLELRAADDEVDVGAAAADVERRRSCARDSADRRELREPLAHLLITSAGV